MVRFCTKQVPASTPEIALPVGYSANPTKYTSYVCKWYDIYFIDIDFPGPTQVAPGPVPKEAAFCRVSTQEIFQIEVISSVEAASYLELLVFCGWWWDKISTGASVGCLSNGISSTGWQLWGVFWSWLEKLYDESLRLYFSYNEVNPERTL